MVRFYTDVLEVFWGIQETEVSNTHAQRQDKCSDIQKQQNYLDTNDVR